MWPAFRDRGRGVVGEGVTCPDPPWGGCFSSVLPRSEFLIFATWSLSSFSFSPPWSSPGWAGGLGEHGPARGTSLRPPCL